jgi:hypothetical protein
VDEKQTYCPFNPHTHFFQKVEAIPILDIGKTCVFSEVKIHLLLDGKPVINKKVVRQWDWNKRGSDERTTDENGYVFFPAIYESSVSRLLPTELVIGQQLSVKLNGEEKVFWTNSKREPEQNAEYGGREFQITCELKNKEVLIEEYGSLMVTLCTLDKGDAK